jgi:hypothetical protein
MSPMRTAALLSVYFILLVMSVRQLAAFLRSLFMLPMAVIHWF